MTKRAPETSEKALAPSLRSAIDAFVVMDVMREANARQAAGGDIIHMEVGQPGTPAPRLVREAVEREMARSAMGYTDALGLPELRERIARHYREAHKHRRFPRPDRCHDGLLGGVCSGVSGSPRSRRRACLAAARLSLLPPDRAGSGAEAGLFAGARRKPVHANAGGCVACLQQKAGARHFAGEPGQSDGSHAACRRSRPSGRSDAGLVHLRRNLPWPHLFRPRRRRRCPFRRMPSSSTASRNTIR